MRLPCCRDVMTGTRVISLAAILSLLYNAPAYAQLAGASLSGLVLDASGAVIANAMVTIKNVSNGDVRYVASNSDGLYSAPNLLPGNYDVTVSASGFATTVQKGVTLTVGATLSLNLSLKVGEVSQQVEVNSTPPEIEASSSTLSSTIQQQVIVDLPLNGRDWTQLATLTPGVSAITVQTSTNTTANRAQRGFGNQLTDSGHRPVENTYRIDGINVNDYTNGAPGSVLGAQLGVDAIEEFNVVTTNYTAAYGRTSGAVVNAITKSGTNQFHGDGFSFYRSEDFDARNFFDPAKIPAYQQKQFGATAGGPISKDKTFIFGAYEGVRQLLSPSFVDTIPSSAARAGNLCSIAIASGPNACSPHAITVDPKVAPYLALWPDPARVTATPVGGPNDNGDTVIYRTSGLKASNENYFSLRGDHNFSAKDSLALTYSYDHSPQNVPDALNNVVNQELSTRQIAGVTETRIFGHGVVNIARIGYNRGGGQANVPYLANNPASVDLALAIPGQPNAGGPPQFLFNGAGAITTAGGEGISHWRHYYNSYQAYDDIAVVRGVHSLSFGFSFERIQYYVGSGGIVEGQNNGSFTFNSTIVGGVTVRSALENLLTNRPFTGSGTPSILVQGLGARVEPRDSVIGGYAQDDWRVRSNLTLNLGLRYEMLTNPTEAHNHFARLNTFTAPAGSGPCPNIYPNAFVTTTVPGCPVPIQKLWQTNPTLRDFDPRVGFSWDPFHNGKTAVRAAFGIFDVLPLPYIYSDGFTSGYPFSQAFTAPPAGTLPQGTFPNIIPLLTPGTPNARYVDPNPKRSYAMNWNLNVQREITKNLGLMVGYVGSHTVHTSFTTDNANVVLPTLINGVMTWPSPLGSGTLLDPNVRQIRQIFWDGSSHYSGLQTQLKLRPMHGLQGQVSYSWGRCFSSGDAAQFGDPFVNSVTSLQYYNPASRYGPCDFDLRHNLTANYIYSIPGPARDSALRWVAGGWQLGGIITTKSGSPFTVLTGGDPVGLKGNDPNGYPDRVGGCNPIAGGVNYLNQSCFVIAPVTANGYVWGNNGRNSLYGPSLFDCDVSMVKSTGMPKISEAFNVQLRFEFFNVLNHTNLQSPVENNVLGATLGHIASTATDSRKIQLGLKVAW